MYPRLINLIFFVLVLSLVGNVQAAQLNWTDGTGDHLWSTDGNWDLGFAPTSADWAKVRAGLPGATITNESVEADRVHIGYEDDSALTMDGGTLVISGDDLLIGKSGGSASLNMISGSIEIHRDLEVAGGDPGVINMSGGTIIVGDDFEVPESQDDVSSIAKVNLDGGTIILDNSYEGDSHFRMYPRGSMNITGGTLIIDGDEVSRIQGYIDNGWITAYGGNGTVQLDFDVTNKGQTTLKGIHKLNPNPVNGGTVAAGELELSWILPDPCVPGQPVNVDVYFTDNYDALQQFTDPAAIRVVSNQNVTSVVVQTQSKTRYYWAVDTYIGDPNDPIFGPIFSFSAGNVPPKVYAGADAVSWLIDGVRTENLDATVTDEEAYTVQWTVVSEPNDPNSPDALITDPSAEDAVVTLSASGEYVLKLEATDGEYTGSDTVTINVYNDSCEAAKSLPDFELLTGDINEDCIVDELDIVILLERWLECNALDCPD